MSTLFTTLYALSGVLLNIMEPVQGVSPTGYMP